MSYRRRLGELTYEAPYEKARLLLLTGQSSFRTSRLQASQIEFLKLASDALKADPVLMGFPFHPALDVSAPQPALVTAALRNAAQFAWCRRDPRFRRTIARALEPWFQSTAQSLYVVTGSCGLQMLAAAWRELRSPARVRVVALGPVCGEHSIPNLATIQAREDWWSRLLYRGPITAYCAGGHLDYWRSEEARALAIQELGK